MRLTPFGEAVRILRLRLGLSLKVMADFMKISSSHLSGIEYGEKKLSDKHVEAVISFFSDKTGDKELQDLRAAAAASKDTISTENLTPDARSLVAAFARRLQEGEAPTPEIQAWLAKRRG